MASLEILRKFASTKLPVRLVAAEEFNGAKELAAMGYIKLGIPPMKKGREPTVSRIPRSYWQSRRQGSVLSRHRLTGIEQLASRDIGA